MRTVEPASTWGVGRVGSHPWPVSRADIEDETQIAVEHLRMLGLGEGALVLITSRLADTIHVAPLEIAAGRIGARWSSADATTADAFRTAALVRQLAPAVVIGIDATVVDALGADASLLDAVPVVAVTDRDAYDAVLHARWWLRLGPTNAFECEARQGAHYDRARWRAEQTTDGIAVTNLAARLTPSERLLTGIDGHVDEAPCRCGRTSPRIVPA